MKASEFVQTDLSDGDTIILDAEIENVINRCCGCGMLHHIKIDRSNPDAIRMTWNRIDGDPDIEDPREVVIEPASQQPDEPDRAKYRTDPTDCYSGEGDDGGGNYG
ncbi:MAG: hypothetical protein KKE53_07620 [Proteobacteria bacterium]|nr:hypothetical protein [Pseudomonadota bacterium]